MENELIKFETAKLAKDKGFDEECDYIWDDGIDLQKLNYYNGGGSGVITNSTLKDDSDTQDAICTVPTQSLLQRWLRDKHRIDIQVICTYKQVRFYHLGIIFINEKNKVDTIMMRDEGMPTLQLFNYHEEALEKGLYQALLLIN